MSLKEIVIGFVAVIALIVSFLALNKPIQEATQSIGVAAGPLHTEFEQFIGGFAVGGVVATSSLSNAVTVNGQEFVNWSKAGLVSYTNNLPTLTLTLPASSTIPQLVPRAGDRQRFCIQNATTTLNTAITIAGGVGMKLNVASSSVSAVGSALLNTGEIGCLTLIREVATSTAFDIDVLLDVYK